jgi:hypothetical protein
MQARAEATVFPPATNAGLTCPQGATQLLMWDGQNQVHCIPIPICATYATYPFGTFPYTTSQLLQFDPAAMQLKCVNPQPGP